MIWTILGMSVAIVAVFCISVAETLVGKPVFEQNREYIAAILVTAGVAAWFAGRYLGNRRRVVADGEGDHAETSRSFVLLDLRYWGPMLLALGIITLFIRPLRQAPVVAVAPRPEAPKVAVVALPPPEPPQTNAPVVFPPLKMQGVIIRENHPFAIINGQSYTIGDHIEGVEIKAIERTGVVLELSGKVKLLALD